MGDPEVDVGEEGLPNGDTRTEPVSDVISAQEGEDGD